jgi:hypothetical protein
VLAEEAPVAFRAEALIKAGIALRKAERFDYALEQIEAGLAIDPDNLTGLQEKGICLQRLALQGKASVFKDWHCRERQTFPSIKSGYITSVC